MVIKMHIIVMKIWMSVLLVMEDVNRDVSTLKDLSGVVADQATFCLLIIRPAFNQVRGISNYSGHKYRMKT